MEEVGMIIKRVCKETEHSDSSLTWMGLDDQGSLWISKGSSTSGEEWKPVLFNQTYQGYYPECRFTAIGATEKDYVAAGIGEDGLPYVFRSLMGGVWESVNLVCGSRLFGYRRASGRIVEILYDLRSKQLFMPCANGELLTIPDCPKCAKIQKVTEERIAGGAFSEDYRHMILMTETGHKLQIGLEEAVQIRVSPDYADQKIKEGGVLADLREMEEDDVGDWLKTQPKNRFIAFICHYGVQADRAARYAREKGYEKAYSLGRARLQFQER